MCTRGYPFETVVTGTIFYRNALHASSRRRSRVTGRAKWNAIVVVTTRYTRPRFDRAVRAIPAQKFCGLTRRKTPVNRAAASEHFFSYWNSVENTARPWIGLPIHRYHRVRPIAYSVRVKPIMFAGIVVSFSRENTPVDVPYERLKAHVLRRSGKNVIPPINVHVRTAAVRSTDFYFLEFRWLNACM